ncbi:Threonine--tRNA ligase protein [Dioscorea alata]|uniref:Threonine--tRNA ligase protein n=1 Tax=Dioscorea alata TaxID=55571 RepID=A0ACB7VIT3_DIOAL|nr:Threonine--tRNA ligase protein [Dioscorea alata]
MRHLLLEAPIVLEGMKKALVVLVHDLAPNWELVSDAINSTLQFKDDAHIFCLENPIKDEIRGVLDLTEEILFQFGFRKYEVNLSTRPEKSKGSDDIWEKAIAALTDVLDDKGWDYQIDEGGGAFYGLKIDLKIEDALERKWQCSTVQVDFNLPQRFDISYLDSNSEKKWPIMIHRAFLGSLQGFFGVLIEHYAGDFPMWISPIQARVLPVTDTEELRNLYIVGEYQLPEVKAGTALYFDFPKPL